MRLDIETTVVTRTLSVYRVGARITVAIAAPTGHAPIVDLTAEQASTLILALEKEREHILEEASK